MMRNLFAAILTTLLFPAVACFAQSSAVAPAGAPAMEDGLRALDSLSFLEGTWDAKGQDSARQGSGASAAGSYTFQLELDGHVLARHSRTAECKAPVGFDCEHGDLLYVYSEASGASTVPGIPGAPVASLKAIYFDSEGHVIHYDVSASKTGPNSRTAVFLSDPMKPGPQFRLEYTLTAGMMSGKFQIRIPGQTSWKSYLEWSGAKK